MLWCPGRGGIVNEGFCPATMALTGQEEVWATVKLVFIPDRQHLLLRTGEAETFSLLSHANVIRGQAPSMDRGVFGMRTAERDVRHALERLKTVEGFDKVRFIILYGSVAEGRARAASDVDLAVYYDGNHEEAARFRFAALSELADDRYDIQIFSHLPLYVRTEALRGKVVYCTDERFLYDVAYRTIREFDDFKPRLYDYIGKEVMT